MNGDHRYYHAPSPNAVAGPSKPSPMPSPQSPHGGLGGTASPTADAGSSSSPPHHPVPLASLGLFLPPPVPTPPKQHLESTQDLLARFHLHSAYDRYVRPATLPGNEAGASGIGAGSGVGSGDKGKGKEVDVDMGETGANMGSDALPGGADGDDDEGPGGKGDKKMKNSYKHLIKGLPGKHSMKKDDYLMNIMLVPPKQRTRITPFDMHTQEDAFAVSPEGLKGWNVNTLVLESAQAREDRKKRKELKRLAKLQQQQQHHHPEHPGDQLSHPGVSLQAPVPTSAQAGASFKPQGTGTPLRKPSTPRSAAVSGGTPRPGSTIPRPGSTISRLGTTTGTPAPPPVQSTPTAPKPPVARPGSTAPRPGSSASSFNGSGLPPRPASTHPQPVVASGGVATPHGEIARGQKRQREDGAFNNGQLAHSNGTGTANSAATNGFGPPAGQGLPPKPILNAKAGNAGVRPRPSKKQRVDGPVQQNGTVQQQPTPQGV